ncbi:unnamed protein product [Vicia faba]|uniref:Uncharacterized protein n=1 Tax=Vicia faba TaxID=3906 RepID=A0AAV0YLQ1_VICFA|nr:unnamed protein product [Vicia faba]
MTNMFSTYVSYVFYLCLFLVTGGNMRNHHDTPIPSGEDSQKTKLSTSGGDKDVPDILYNMLTEPQVHKENNDHVHEDVKVDDGVVNNHNHAFEYVKTLGKGVNESISTINGE